jgi:hypothetical protein
MLWLWAVLLHLQQRRVSHVVAAVPLLLLLLLLLLAVKCPLNSGLMCPCRRCCACGLRWGTEVGVSLQCCCSCAVQADDVQRDVLKLPVVTAVHGYMRRCNRECYVCASKRQQK